MDIYCSIKLGASAGIIPEKYFKEPIKVLQFCEQHKVTVIRWVPTVFRMISSLSGLKKIRPSHIQTIIFGGEVLPPQTYQYWRGFYPVASCIQVYGPTEITGVCTYHFINEDDATKEYIPIGKSFYNIRVFLLDENDEIITEKEKMGEICVSGRGVSLGYYNNSVKTEEVFCVNPLNNKWNERIYRTGDLAKYDNNYDLIFLSRKDFQIKHMGHRIELGEIESAISSNTQVADACCVYNTKQRLIVSYIVPKGELTQEEMREYLESKLVHYMMPGKYVFLDKLPQLPNGKIDRKNLYERL